MVKQERVIDIVPSIRKSGTKITTEFSVEKMQKPIKTVSHELAKLRSEGVKQRADTWSRTKKHESRQSAKLKLRKEYE